MAKKRLNKYLGALLMGGVIMAIPSCSDYDDHFLPDESEGAIVTETLWEQIKSDQELSRFAAILEKAKYYKDNTHPVATYTYADVLKSGQVSTVWAPVNGYLTQEECDYWLKMCETNGYIVEQQFIRNHIALWRHNLTGGGADTIKMMNAKNILFDRDAETIDGIKIKEKNIPAINGVLHKINGKTTFEYNFYEYIKYAEMTPKFSDFVIGYDTTMFSIERSIEGLPDENGNPTYVDSVYYTTNRLVNSRSWLPNTNAEKCMNIVKGFGNNSNIMAEDSAYIMVIPTDKAIEETYEKLKGYYTYAPTYEDKSKGNISPATTITLKDYDPDSLQRLNIMMDIASPLVYNIHRQPKIGGYEYGAPWTLEKFIETRGEGAEYLINTFGDTIRNVVDGDNIIWNKTSLFNGNLQKMSNGYAYLADKWAFPIEYYKPPVIVEIGGYMFYGTSNTQYFAGRVETKSFNNTVFADVTNKYGKVGKNNFISFKNGSSNPKGEIILQGNVREQYMPTESQVMSGKYDIYVVMVPKWYSDISDAGEIDSLYYDEAYVDSIAGLCKNRIKVQVRYNSGVGTKDAMYPASVNAAPDIEYDGTKVDTVKVLENFTFPYSYKNLRYSYPTLIIQSSGTLRSSDLKNGYIRDLYIDQVILKSKEDNSEIVIAQ